MFVSDLSEDRWDGFIEKGTLIQSPTLADIERAVHKLDGEEYTLITMGAEGETHLAVGGGSAGRYVVYATFDNMAFHNLLGPGDKSDTVYLTAGGQEGDYPGNTIVDRETALAAALTFAESGELDPRFTWEED
jgi:hypothetical protein